MFSLKWMRKVGQEWQASVTVQVRGFWIWSKDETQTNEYFQELGSWINVKSGYSAGPDLHRFLDAKQRLEKRFRKKHEGKK